MNFVEYIKTIPDYIGSDGRTETEIIKAEKALGISFAKDYREYLSEIGLACFDGHELTGLSKLSREDVVSVTMEQQELLGDFVSRWYVIEEANIDGIVIWQDSDGIVYQTVPNIKSKKIASSLLEYIGR